MAWPSRFSELPPLESSVSSWSSVTVIAYADLPIASCARAPLQNQMSAALQKPSVRATARERSRRSSPNGREAREQRSELVKGFLVGAVRGRRRCPRCERRPGRHGVLPFCPEAKPGRKLSTVRARRHGGLRPFSGRAERSIATELRSFWHRWLSRHPSPLRIQCSVG